MAEDLWQNIEENIIDQYVNDSIQRPWVIAFSGGKDSTTLLQVVWNSLLKIEPNQRTRDIYIVCNNPLNMYSLIVKKPLVVLENRQM